MPSIIYSAQRFCAFLLLTVSLSFSLPNKLCAQSTERPVQEQGEVHKGKPTGVWKYYDGNELGLVINYDSSRVRYVRPDTARYLVWVDSAWQLKRLNRAPRLLGSRNEVVAALQRSLRYPSAALQKGATGHVVVTCVVDETGQVSKAKLVSFPNEALGKEVQEKVDNLNIRFLPGIYRGRPALTRVSFVVSFAIGRSSAKVNAFVNEAPKAPGAFNQIVVTALGL